MHVIARSPFGATWQSVFLKQFFTTIRTMLGQAADTVQSASTVGAFDEQKTPEHTQCDHPNTGPGNRMQTAEFADFCTDSRDHETTQQKDRVDFYMGGHIQILQFLYHCAAASELHICKRLPEWWEQAPALHGYVRYV